MQSLDVMLIAVVAAVVGALLVIVLARRGKVDLERRLAVQEERSSRISGLELGLAEKIGQVDELRTRLATLQETLDQERKRAEDKDAFLRDAKERMTQEFKLLAEDVMRLHGENFSKQNKEQIETVLVPLREKLGEFQQGIQAAHTESARDHATLVEQIRQLTFFWPRLAEPDRIVGVLTWPRIATSQTDANVETNFLPPSFGPQN